MTIFSPTRRWLRQARITDSPEADLELAQGPLPNDVTDQPHLNGGQ
jgi:hypothetical protein